MKKILILLTSLLVGFTCNTFASSKESKLTSLSSAFKTPADNQKLDKSNVEIVYGGADIERTNFDTSPVAV